MKDDIAAATAMKKEYQKVEQNARQLIEQIATNKAYSSLENPQNLDILKELYTGLTASVTEFGQEFLLEDLKEIKNKYVSATLKSHLKQFCKLDVKQVAEFTAKLMRRKSA